MSSLTSGGWPDNPYRAVPGVLDDDKVPRRRFPNEPSRRQTGYRLNIADIPAGPHR
jgi:hypothetical protein